MIRRSVTVPFLSNASCFSVGAAGAALLWAARTASAALVCAAPRHDFGVRPETSLGCEHTFEVRNDGPRPVVISDIRTSCDCLVVALAHRTLQPSETVPVDAHFVFDGKSGPQLRTIHLRYRDADSIDMSTTDELILFVTGTVLTPVLRDPNRMDLGLVAPGSVAEGSILLTEGRCGPFAIQAIDAPEGLRWEATTGVRGAVHPVRLFVPVPLRDGTFTGKVVARTDLEEMPTVPIHYFGNVVPRIKATPSTLLLPSGQGFDATVRLSSPLGTAFRVVGVTATDPEMTVSATPDGEAIRLQVARPRSTAPFQGAQVRVETDLPDCRIVEIPVRAVLEGGPTQPKGIAP